MRTVTLAAIVGGTSLVLLLGALLFEHVGGLPPCELCVWQRWPHGAAAVLGLSAALLLHLGAVPRAVGGTLAALAVVALAASGAIGVYHAGVEWQFWAGPGACAGLGYVPGLDELAPFRVVRCDIAEWRLFGLSLAGYNALVSLGIAGAGAALLWRKRLWRKR